MSKTSIKYLFSLIPISLLLLAPSGWTTATALGKTKPNVSIIDEKYRPPKNAKKSKDYQTARRLLVELSEENERLAIELGKLPELQDGISSSELAALRSLVEVYGSDANAFDSAFRQMYQIGKPEARKYCSPLQAVFWLAQKDVEEVKKQFEFYETESLLDAAWDFLENELTLSEKEAKEVIVSVKDKELGSKYYAFLDRPEALSRIILMDYKKKPRVFSREARKIIKSSLRREKNLRWRDFNVVVERLNAPELLDYYLRNRFTYNHVRVQPHAPKTTFSRKWGDCDDLAIFGLHVLRRAGYRTFGRFVHYNPGHRGHVGAGIRTEDGSYLLVVDFSDLGNLMSGPYTDILDVDRTLSRGSHGRSVYERGWWPR